ncbi:MAG: magnesium/cobalt efflux protein [Gammaproteobacteria bacterium HGW-Gammaproteobacteria-8]|nr:MAG: magnesium/cobalt efflux protein [Gammaproteobacteria bacterium HGW-Gammaproteobacteria-8]
MNEESDSSSGHSPSSNGSGGKTWLERLGRVFGADPRSREDLVELLREAAERGLIETETLTMIEGALEVDELQVRDAMIPRSQMVVIHQGDSLDEILPLIIESGHSRFPVVGEDKDELKGILLAKDLLKLVVRDSTLKLSDLVREPVIIPESKRLNILLREFRQSRNHMAIVVDEYGGVAGLITIEDVLEEIVGDIDDEHDAETVEDIQKLADQRFLVQALTLIEDFNKAFGTEFSDEEFDTIGGLVVGQFGYVPEVDEAVEFGGWRFEVTAADDRRLQAMEVSPAVGEPESED